MNAGDIQLHQEFDINTGETTTVEYVVTDKDVEDEFAREHQDRINRAKEDLKNLNSEFPEAMEEYIKATKTPITLEFEDILHRKHDARMFLKKMGEECQRKCIDETKLNGNDTTELFLRKIIFDLAKRIKTLENGGV